MVLDAILNERGQDGDYVSPLPGESVVHLSVVSMIDYSFYDTFLLKIPKTN